MAPTWTPAFCPPSPWQRRRAREPRKACPRAAISVSPPPKKKGTTPRAFSSSFEPPRYQARYFFLPSSRLRSGKGEVGEDVETDERKRLRGYRGFAGETPHPASGAQEDKGSVETFYSPHPHTLRLPKHPQKSPTDTILPSAPKHSQSVACSKKDFLEGAKGTFFFFFYLPAQPGAMESRRSSWAVGGFGDIIIKIIFMTV